MDKRRAVPHSDRTLPASGWVTALLVVAGLPVLVSLEGPGPVADAAMRGDAAAVRALIAEGADVNVPQGDGMTALHWAAQNRDAALVRDLLEAGA